MKVTGVPYEEIATQGGGIASSARAFAAASDAEVLAQAGTLGAEMLAPRHHDVRVQVGLRAVRRAASCARFAWPRSCGSACRRTPPARRCSRTRCRRATRPTAGWTRWSACCRSRGRQGARHLRRAVGGVLQRAPGAHGRARRRAHGLDAARARRAVLHQPLGARGARGTARAPWTTSPACTPTTSRRSPRASARRCCCPAPSSWAPSRWRPPASSPTPAPSACWPPTANPGTSPVVSLPLVIGLAVRRYGWSVREALLAVTLNAAHVLGRAAEIGSIEPGKRADWCCSTGPPSGCRTASATTPWRWC